MANLDGFQEHRFSRTEIAELVKKYWLLVLGTCLAGTVVMWLSFFIYFTDLYESKTKLLVKIGRENADTPTTVQRGQVLSQGVRVTDTNSEVEILSSRALVEAVVDRLGPEAFQSVLAPPESWWGYPKYYVKKAGRGVKYLYKEFLILTSLKKRLTPREEAIVRVADGVEVEPVRDSDILVLSVRTPSAQLSVQVANVLLEVYMQQRAEARRVPAGSDFFVARREEARQRLGAAEKARAAVRERWDLTAAEGQRAYYLGELSAIQAEVVRNEAEIAKLQRQRGLMESRIPALPELVRKEQVDAVNPSIQSIKERITTLKLERAKLASRYRPDSEVMRKIDAEIADVEAALRAEPSSILDSVTAQENPSRREFIAGIEQQTVQIAGLESRNRALQGPAAQLAARLKELTLGMDALANAEREYKRAEEDYLAYAKRLEEARMSEALDAQRVTNVAIVAPPDTPIAPVYPRKMFLIGIAMAVSLVLGLAAAAVIETTEDRLLDAKGVIAMDDVTYLGTVEVRKAS